MTVRGVIDLGTDRVKQVLSSLDHPEARIARKQIVHVTGTNGKGSTVEMIATGLAALGNKVGVFTSPFLIQETDSIRIFERETITEISESELVRLRDNAVSQFCRDALTDFEALFVAAILFFSAQSLDVAVIEVGMGGREDATNVFQSSRIRPPICVLTSVSLDHEKFLGPTIEHICDHKCGIVQEGALFVVNANIAHTCKDIVNKRVAEMHAKVKYVSGDDFVSPLNGQHQKMLTAIAIAVIREIESQVSTEEAIAAVARTKLPGRLERRFDCPVVPFPVILDGAHNAESAVALRKFIDAELVSANKSKTVWIIATSEGRQGIVPILVQDTDDVLFISFKSFSNTAHWVRACDPSVLANQLSAEHTGSTSTLPDKYIADALSIVSKRRDLDDCLVVVAGSLYLVRNYLIHLANSR